MQNISKSGGPRINKVWEPLFETLVITRFLYRVGQKTSHILNFYYGNAVAVIRLV